MTHETATPTFCIHVQHSWIYSVTQTACGTLSFDDCIISWHYLIQSRYMHNEAWTKKLPNLLSFLIGVCIHDSGLSFSLLHVFLVAFLHLVSSLGALLTFSCILNYSTHQSFLMSPPLVNPLFSTLLSSFLISAFIAPFALFFCFCIFSTSPPQFYPLVLSSISWQWKC